MIGRWLALLVLLLPGAAAADPATIAAVASWWASYGWVVQTVMVVASVYGSIEQRRKQKAAAAAGRQRFNDSLENRSVTVLSATPPWRVIYGRPGPVGGAIVAIFTTDKTAIGADGATYTKPDALKHMVVEIAHHECQAINEVFIDGVPLGALDGSGYVQSGSEFYAARTYARSVLVPAGGFVDLGATANSIVSAVMVVGSGENQNITPISSCTLSLSNTRVNNPEAEPVDVVLEMQYNVQSVRVQKHLGTSGQTVDTYLNGLLPTEWDANRRLRGATYCVITLDLEEPRFQGGPPNFTFDVSGKKCYDPRTATTVYTENNALCIADFLMAEWGMEVLQADINSAAWIKAANDCDASISMTIGGSTTSGPRFTLNGTFTTEDDREQVLADMADSMAGIVTNAGEWFIRAGVWEASVMDLGPDDLDGHIQFQRTATAYEDLFNGMSGRHIPRGQSTPIDFEVYQNAAFLADDGEELWESRDFNWTDNRARARNLCRIFTEANRLGAVIVFPAKLRAIRLQPGDRVRVSSPEHGWTLKNFRVIDWDMQVRAPVNLLLREDEPETYDLADAASAYPVANTGLPSPWIVATPSSVAATSALKQTTDGGYVPLVTVTWAATASPYVAVGGRIMVRWQRVDGKWFTEGAPGDSRALSFVGPAPGTRIVIGVSAENSLGARSNEALIALTIQPILYPAGTLALTPHGAGSVVVNGTTIERVDAGGTAWNAGAYSAAPIRNACALTFRIPRTDRNVLIGLNTDPTTDASYTSIDFALFFDSAGLCGVYEGGTLIVTAGAYSAGAVGSIEYDGIAVRYYVAGVLVHQRAAAPGLQLYVDSSMYQGGARAEGITFVPLAASQRGNLLDSGSWVIGTTGSQGTTGGNRFGDMGQAGESAIVEDVAPDGLRSAIWQATSVDNYGTSDGDGGWEDTAAVVPIDPDKMYRFLCWYKAKTTTGAQQGGIYLGCKGGVLDIATGAVQSNPYFISGFARSSLVVGRWYVGVGYVLPKNHGTVQHNMSGLWDAVTGERVYSGADYKWATTAVNTYHRSFMYYADTDNVTQFWRPRLDLCDGTEPALDQLLQLAGSVNTSQLVANSATATDFKSGGSGSWVSNPTGDAVVIGTTATGGSGVGAATSFTNNTGGAVVVQIDSTMFELNDAGTGGTPSVFIRYQINGGSFVTAALYGTGGGASPGLGVGFAQINLAAGQSLTNLQLMGATTALKTAQFSGWTLRMTAILR